MMIGRSFSFLISTIILLILSPFLCFNHQEVHAEVVFDGTLGPAGSLAGEQHSDFFDYVVDAGYGQQLGANLFHSFETFNLYYYDFVQVAERAIFTGPDGIENIISRVTGGSFSSIDGTIQSDIAGANLFLINPTGVMFGPHAALEVDGSFHVSTADYLRLGDTGVFDATDPQNSSLVSAPPSAFGFLNENPAAITFYGSGSYDAESAANSYDWTGLSSNGMKVPSGETLSVVGGDITITEGNLFYGWFGDWPVETQLQAPNGQLNIVSVASAGEAVFDGQELMTDSFAQLGQIDILNNSDISANSYDDPPTYGGTVFIRGGNLTIDNATVESSNYGSSEQFPGSIDIGLHEDLYVQNGGEIATTALYSDSGSIMIAARDVIVTTGSAINTTNYSFDNGEVGDINISAAGLYIYNEGMISTNTWSNEASGDILINLTDELLINGDTAENQFSTGINVTNGFDSGGFAGSLTINTPSILMGNGVISNNTWNENPAGKIELNVDQLGVYDDGIIIGTTYGAGNGGDLEINATDLVLVTGTGKIESGPSLLFSGDSYGGGGTITINTDSLKVTDGGSIDSSSYDGDGRGGDIIVEADSLISITTDSLNTEGFGSTISSNTYDMGQGGDIYLTSPTVEMDYSTIETSSICLLGGEECGNAGGIYMIINSLSLSDSSEIRADTSGSGLGGEIGILTDQLVLEGGSRINSGTQYGSTGNAGDTVILASDEIIITGEDSDGRSSGILSEIYGEGSGGVIYLETPTLSLVDGGIITSQSDTYSEGDSGIIYIVSNELLMKGYRQTDWQSSFISSSTDGAGAAGGIIIETGSLVIKDGAVITSTSFQNAGEEADAGIIQITADEISLSGANPYDTFSSRIESNAYSSGAGGFINIEAGSVELIDGATIDTTAYSEGEGGIIQITADEISLSGVNLYNGYPSSISSNTEGTGNALGILIETGTLELTDGTLINTSTYADGAGGVILIKADGLISLSGSTVAGDGWGSAIASQSQGAGNAGYILIEAGSMTMTEGGQVSCGAYDDGNGGYIDILTGGEISISGTMTDNDGVVWGSGVYCTAGGDGNAGTISIAAPALTLFNKGTVDNSTSAAGFGDDINILVDQLELSDDATITAQSTGTGDAGNISITSNDFVELFDSSITTEANEADGGNINIYADSMLHLVNSKITATVGGGEGNGGNIYIDPVFIILQNSSIIANAYGGNGGNITLIADQFIADPQSVVQASSELGIDGSVVIDSPATDVSGNLAVLPSVYLDATALLQNSCMLGSGEETSSLVMAGRGGMPVGPGEYLPSTQMDLGDFTRDDQVNRQKEEEK